MNEKELIQNKKIEKREKIDRIIAYILIVILLGGILFVLYLKYVKKDNATPNDNNYTTKYITLDNINTSLNTSNLAKKYKEENIVFNSKTLNNSLIITYQKDSKVVNLNIPLNNNELTIQITDDNKDIITDVYKEIATIICTFYNNNENACRSTINEISISNLIDGIRMTEEGGTTTVYLDINEKIKIDNTTSYNEATNLDLTETNYQLTLKDTIINNINIINNDNVLKLTGTIKNLLTEDVSLSVLVKLYDEKGTFLVENKKEFDSANLLSGESTFEVSFILNDQLKIENIKKYSIEVIK